MGKVQKLPIGKPLKLFLSRLIDPEMDLRPDDAAQALRLLESRDRKVAEYNDAQHGETRRRSFVWAIAIVAGVGLIVMLILSLFVGGLPERQMHRQVKPSQGRNYSQAQDIFNTYQKKTQKQN